MKKSIQDREAIITEYLLGNTTYRKLGDKHGVDFRTLYGWVRDFQGKTMSKKKPQKSEKQINVESLPSDVKQLQEELRKARLHNKLLNTIIDLAEEQLNVDIRKKSGTKR
jgi:transposase-like protein